MKKALMVLLFAILCSWSTWIIFPYPVIYYKSEECYGNTSSSTTPQLEQEHQQRPASELITQDSPQPPEKTENEPDLEFECLFESMIHAQLQLTAPVTQNTTCQVDVAVQDKMGEESVTHQDSGMEHKKTEINTIEDTNTISQITNNPTLIEIKKQKESADCVECCSVQPDPTCKITSMTMLLPKDPTKQAVPELESQCQAVGSTQEPMAATHPMETEFTLEPQDPNTQIQSDSEHELSETITEPSEAIVQVEKNRPTQTNLETAKQHQPEGTTQEPMVTTLPVEVEFTFEPMEENTQIQSEYEHVLSANITEPSNALIQLENVLSHLKLNDQPAQTHIEPVNQHQPEGTTQEPMVTTLPVEVEFTSEPTDPNTELQSGSEHELLGTTMEPSATITEMEEEETTSEPVDPTGTTAGTIQESTDAAPEPEHRSEEDYKIYTKTLVMICAESSEPMLFHFDSDQGIDKDLHLTCDCTAFNNRLSNVVNALFEFVVHISCKDLCKQLC